RYHAGTEVPVGNDAYQARVLFVGIATCDEQGRDALFRHYRGGLVNSVLPIQGDGRSADQAHHSYLHQIADPTGRLDDRLQPTRALRVDEIGEVIASCA